MRSTSTAHSCLTLCLAIGLSISHLTSTLASENEKPAASENEKPAASENEKPAASEKEGAKSDKKPIASELSVAPSDYRVYPKDRPGWVDSAPNLTSIPHRWPVASAPCRTESLAQESLLVNTRAAIETYIETLTGAPEAGELVKLDDEWLRQHRDRTKVYHGTIQEGDETLYESATVLVITPEDQAMIKLLWQQHLVSQRLAALGIVATGVVAAFVGSAAGLSIVTRRAEKRVTG